LLFKLAASGKFGLAMKVDETEVNYVSEFIKKLDEDTIRAAEKFIEDIKAGLCRRRTLPRISEKKSLYQTEKSFRNFVTTEEFGKTSESD
jgi:hypothetical protein